ncbi:MAG: hypothetical protein H0S82_00040 [Anaerolineaceae bacterium]|nr:hypothetical protein [Anaerolineaceae bacterium]
MEIYLNPVQEGTLAVQIGRQCLEVKVENFQQRVHRTTVKSTDGDL